LIESKEKNDKVRKNESGIGASAADAHVWPGRQPGPGNGHVENDVRGSQEDHAEHSFKAQEGQLFELDDFMTSLRQKQNPNPPLCPRRKKSSIGRSKPNP
jgi:hypothetical protein